MKALVGAFNQKKALVGAFSLIVKTYCETDGSFYSTKISTLTEYRDGDGGLQLPVAGVHGGAAVLARVLVSQPLDEEGDGHVLGLDLGVHPAHARVRGQAPGGACCVLCHGFISPIVVQ